MSGIRDAMASARRVVSEDPNLAVFIVRDYEVLEKAGLKDLAWAMYKNYATPNEVRGLLDDIETWLDQQPPAPQPDERGAE